MSFKKVSTNGNYRMGQTTNQSNCPFQGRLWVGIQTPVIPSVKEATDSLQCTHIYTPPLVTNESESGAQAAILRTN